MTEKQKKLGLIIGTIILALIILLWGRKANGSTIVNQKDMPPIQVNIPSLDLPPRTAIPIIIPGLPTFTPYGYSPISPCMCDGAGSLSSMNNDTPLVEFIMNEGNVGGSTYNYNTVQSQPTTSWLSNFAAR